MRVLRATTADGRPVDFDPDPIGEGGMKLVYRTTDNSSVVCFFKDQSDRQRRQRLEAVVGRLNPTLNRENGAYWKTLFCWPTAIVECPGHGLGIVAPRYPENFYFTKGALKGKEKSGKWFFAHSVGGTPLRELIAVSERGDWLAFLKVCIHIARAVRRLHFGGLAHSDLSSKNVLVDPSTGRAILIDIDSLVVKGLFPPDVDGTPEYIAPEVLASRHLPIGSPGRRVASTETDLHALAVLVYQYLLSRHPLDGCRILSKVAEEDEFLSFGARALFVEHSSDRSNSPKKPIRVSYTILGAPLSGLIRRAFEEGLHNPSLRPRASEWERALMLTFDSILPCGNTSCTGKWYPVTKTGKRACPWCGTIYAQSVPVLSFHDEKKPGQWHADSEAIAYQDWCLFKRHVFSNAATGENADRTPQAIVTWHKGNWLLVNEALTSMTSLMGNPVGKKQAVVLQHGSRFRLAQEPCGRLMEVRLLPP